MLQSNPKRSDLWYLYIDKEIKKGYYPQARQLFQRLVSTKLGLKGQKAAFKKFLAFETEHGSDRDRQAVLGMAREFTQSLK